MYENIKELINNSNYNEAKTLIVEELKIDDNPDLWYLLFLSENNNYLEFDPNNINNSYAYNQATRSENEEYESEFKLYKDLALLGLNKIFRLIQIEKFNEIDGLIENITNVNLNLSKMSSLYINDIILVKDEIKLNYYLKLFEHINDGELNLKNKINSFIKENNINTRRISTKKQSNPNDFIISKCKLIKYIGNETDVVVPGGVTVIGKEAFYSCKNIRSVVIPKGVIEIEESAFQYCSNLMRIVLPKSLKKICGYDDLLNKKNTNAFYECIKLVEIYNLSSLDITTGSTLHGEVGLYAKVIHSIIKEESNIIKKDDYVFLKDNNDYYLINYVGKDSEIVLPNDILGNNYSINKYSFCSCNNIYKITIPETVISISDNAFSDCYRLVEVYNLSSIIISSSIIRYTKVIHSKIDDESNVIKKDNYVFLKDNNDYFLIAYEGKDTELILPSDILGHSYKINRYAFYGCSELINITIPEGITLIDDFTFGNCSNLKTINISNTVKSIGDFAFASCNNLVEIVLPDTLDSIGFKAFDNCSNLRKINIPEGIKTIKLGTFNNCYNILSITLPSTLKRIEDSSFSNCYRLVEIYNLSTLKLKVGSVTNGKIALYAKFIHDSLDEESELITKDNYVFINNQSDYYLISSYNDTDNLELPNDVNGNNYKINDYAFYMNKDIKTIVISDGVTEIGSYAFTQCINLNKITLGKNLMKINKNAFLDCNIKEIHNNSSLRLSKNTDSQGLIAKNAEFIYKNNKLLTSNTKKESKPKINKDFQITNGKLEKYKGNNKEVIIPNEVTEIGAYAFTNCESLTKVTIPNSVKIIGDHAFRSCSNLTSITIPSSVTSIGKQVFYYCRSLTSITIPSSVTSIGEYAFEYCDSLTNVYYDGTIDSWCSIIFSAYNSNPMDSAKKFYILDENGKIENSGKKYTLVTEIIIPNTVTKIGEYQFEGFKNITSITIPSSVTSIGYRAFYFCKSLTSITIPLSVTSIGNDAFSFSSLTSITIPSSVTSIGNSAFSVCSNLTSITIPSSVTSIGNDVFYLCSNLKEIRCYKNNLKIIKKALSFTQRLKIKKI